jgi:hypothetical protein
MIIYFVFGVVAGVAITLVVQWVLRKMQSKVPRVF